MSDFSRPHDLTNFQLQAETSRKNPNLIRNILVVCEVVFVCEVAFGGQLVVTVNVLIEEKSKARSSLTKIEVPLTLLFVLQLNLGTLSCDDLPVLDIGLDEAMGLGTGYFFVLADAWSHINLVSLVGA